MTVDGPRSHALIDAGEAVDTLPIFDLQHSDPINLLRSLTLVLRLRPRYVVTTGAGVVLTFTLLAWLLGAKIVFIETMARVSLPSKTGAVLARIAQLHIVQWAELGERFPRAVVCRPVLLPDVVRLRDDGEGTFVSLGTHPAPFGRLLNMVDEALENGTLPEPCVVQGPTGIDGYARMTFTGSVSPEDFRAYLRRSRYVLGHAGAGFISAALEEGRRPIVLARTRKLGEHVDDHQLELTRKLVGLGLVVDARDGVRRGELSAADAPFAGDRDSIGLPTVTEVVGQYFAEVNERRGT